MRRSTWRGGWRMGAPARVNERMWRRGVRMRVRLVARFGKRMRQQAHAIEDSEQERRLPI
jgi:hypothetical protein